jgi:hypothetical protein
MAEDPTYQTLVYHEREGDAEVVKSEGIIRGHSGGIMSADSGFIHTLASQDVLTKDITRVVHSRNDPLVITPALASVKLTGQSMLPSNVRFVTIIGSVTMSKASYYLTPCSAGAEVFIHVVGDVSGGFTNDNTSLTLYLSGCTLLASTGSVLASMTFHTSAASDAGVHLIAPLENTWAIVSTFGADTVES